MKRALLHIRTITIFILLIVTIGSGYRSDAEETSKIKGKGVLDRFEGDQAVILIEEWNEEMILSKSALPSGSDVNMWFSVEKKDAKIEIISIDFEKTDEEIEKTKRLKEKLLIDK